MSADPGHPHNHGHGHDNGQEPPSPTALRVKALESLLVEKGLVDSAALDAIIDYYENKVGLGTEHASSHGPGPIPRTGRGCLQMRPPP